MDAKLNVNILSFIILPVKQSDEHEIIHQAGEMQAVAGWLSYTSCRTNRIAQKKKMQVKKKIINLYNISKNDKTVK